MWVFITCPYCGVEQRTEIELWELSGDPPKVIKCLKEGGGCHQYFVAEFSVHVSVKTHELDG